MPATWENLGCGDRRADSSANERAFEPKAQPEKCRLSCLSRDFHCNLRLKGIPGPAATQR